MRPGGCVIFLNILMNKKAIQRKIELTTALLGLINDDC